MGFTRDGDGSTLSLDFTQGILDSRISFSRSTTATFISVGNLTDPTLTIESVGGSVVGDWDDPNIWDIAKSPRDGQVLVTILVGDTVTFNDYNTGVLLSTASVNQPRFDHDPTTLAPRGLLIEGSATNVLTGFAAGSWGRQNINGSGTGGALTNGQTGPGGVANTAARITTAASTTFPTGMFVAFATNAAGNSRTFSVWLRGVGANTTASIAIVGSNTPTGVASSQSGHSVTLATSTSGNNLLALVTGLSTTAWTRVSISRTDTQASSDSYRVCPGNHTSTISSGLAVDVYVPQAESGIGMSSTIPTVASQVTRNADNCTMPTSSFITGTLYPHTLFVDCIPATPSGAFLNLARIFDRTPGGTYAYGTELYYYNAATMSANRKINASTNTDRSLASGLAYGSRHKFALSINSSSFSSAYDGVAGLGATTAPAALPTIATHLGIGCSGDASSGAVMFGTIRQIKFWPIALSQSAINALTTL